MTRRHRRLTWALLPVTVAASMSAVGCTDEPDTQAFCAAARRAGSADLSATFALYDPANPEAAKAELDEAVDQLRDLRDTASGAIRDDVETLVAMADDLIDSLTDLRDDPEAATARLQELQADFPEVEAASARLVGHTRSACEVDLAG
ncbi:MAG: hypothetical protein ACRD0U_17805 [Acidimicrobiales bacterium]